MTYKVTIVFGTEEVCLYENDPSQLEGLLQTNHANTFTFDTEQELSAFLLGVEEACGWLDYTIVKDDYWF